MLPVPSSSDSNDEADATTLSMLLPDIPGASLPDGAELSAGCLPSCYRACVVIHSSEVDGWLIYAYSSPLISTVFHY